VPELIMRALFARGAFTAADAQAAGQTLAAYAVGLVPFVLIRSATAAFLARGDTATPVKAALAAAAVNILLKMLLMGPLAQVGLALATSVGGWINLALVLWLAKRAGFLTPDPAFGRSLVKLVGAGLVLATVLWLAQPPVTHALTTWTSLRDETALTVLAALGGVAYGGMVVALFGRRWLRGRRRT